MCNLCVQDCVLFHEYAIATLGSMSLSTEFSFLVISNSDDAKHMLTIGIGMCSESFRTQMPPGHRGRVVIMRKSHMPDVPPDHIALADTFISIMQKILDGDIDGYLDAITRYVDEHGQAGSVKLFGLSACFYTMQLATNRKENRPTTN